MIPTVLCLGSGRSGTHYLYEILRRNLRGAVCRHEPYLWNPSMFGRPIYDHAVGDEAAVRRVALKKRRAIEAFAGSAAYIETSHAFLKSWSDHAIEFFPRMKLIHLVRNPLAVAKSEAVREDLIHRWRMPFRNYRGGDGRSYFRWSLTGLEPIFAELLPGPPLTRLQWYVVQWIEIENRAMEFLKRYAKQSDCFTLHSPGELNDPDRVRSLFDFLDLPRTDRLILQGSHNRTPGVRSELTDGDRRQLADVVHRLPDRYRQIFREPPYCDWMWSAEL
jgi:hypothetical protein